MLEKVKDRLFLLREGGKLKVAHRVLSLYLVVFLIWGLYRLLFRMPVWIEEVILKGLVMGGAVWVATWVKEKKGWASLGVRMENFVPAVGLGLGLGIILLFVGELANFVQYGKLVIDPVYLSPGKFGAFMLLALVTAWWEELLMMGYVLQRLKEVWESEWARTIVTAGLFALLHMPAKVFGSGLTIWQVLLQLLLVFSVGFGNAVMMLRSENLVTPVLTHALWGVSVFLFR